MGPSPSWCSSRIGHSFLRICPDLAVADATRVCALTIVARCSGAFAPARMLLDPREVHSVDYRPKEAGRPLESPHAAHSVFLPSDPSNRWLIHWLLSGDGLFRDISSRHVLLWLSGASRVGS